MVEAIISVQEPSLIEYSIFTFVIPLLVYPILVLELACILCPTVGVSTEDTFCRVKVELDSSFTSVSEASLTLILNPVPPEETSGVQP